MLVPGISPGQQAIRLTSDVSDDYDPDWSPDGDSICFTSNRSGYQHIYAIPVSGGSAIAISSGISEDIHPCWIPDGGFIAFSSDRSGNQELWLQSLSNPAMTNITNSEASEESIDYSGDGQFLCFNSNRSSGNWDLWKQVRSSGTLVRLTTHPSNDGEPAISPDGHKIAFISGRAGHIDIWVMNSDGSSARALTNDAYLDLMPCWTPDGQYITYASNRNGNFDIWSVPVSGGESVLITGEAADEVYPSWSPDGSCLAYSSEESGNSDIYLLYQQSAAAPSVIPSGSEVVIDGKMDRGEWDDALPHRITSSGRTILFRIKHDAASLLIGVELKNSGSGPVRFPEILIDPRNDKSYLWQQDDWWFHVSATDCFHQGNHSEYTTCETDHAEWDALPNFSTSASDPPVDSIEIRIPFETLGITLLDTIGLSFDVTNTFNAWELWPDGASLDHPDTWGTFVFESPSSASNLIGDDVKPILYPNPAGSELWLDFNLKQASGYSITITDLQGKIVRIKNMDLALPGKILEHLSLEEVDMPPGLYCLTLVLSGEQTGSFLFYKI